MLSSNVLVLNSSFMPIQVTSVRRALVLLYQGIAKVVGQEFETFDFQSWAELRVAVDGEGIGLVDRMIRVPRVIVLSSYDRIPKKMVRLSRLNIYLRDQHTCQYCGVQMKRSDLNLDHVVPRSQGGKTSWENVVTCCLPCNHKKGGYSPLEAGMHLIRAPIRPKWTPFIQFSLRQIHYEEWKPFLNIVDYSYWNSELQAD